MSEQRETYKLTSGRLSDESPYVKQQIAMQLKELAGSGQVLVGYREYSVMQGVPPEVLKTVEVLMGAGMDVIQAGRVPFPNSLCNPESFEHQQFTQMMKPHSTSTQAAATFKESSL